MNAFRQKSLDKAALSCDFCLGRRPSWGSGGVFVKSVSLCAGCLAVCPQIDPTGVPPEASHSSACPLTRMIGPVRWASLSWQVAGPSAKVGCCGRLSQSLGFWRCLVRRYSAVQCGCRPRLPLLVRCLGCVGACACVRAVTESRADASFRGRFRRPAFAILGPASAVCCRVGVVCGSEMRRWFVSSLRLLVRGGIWWAMVGRRLVGVIGGEKRRVVWSGHALSRARGRFWAGAW